MKRITLFRGRDNIEGEITREELEFLLYYHMAVFTESVYDKGRHAYVDRWRYYWG